MDIDDDWNANENTNQVENDVVNALLDADANTVMDAEGVAIPVEESHKFHVIDYSEALEKANTDQKVTLPIMSKYEKAKIIGYRATQIAKGAIPLVNVKGLKDPYEKAEKELAEKKTPLIVRRVLPNNTYEDWKIEEFLF